MGMFNFPATQLTPPKWVPADVGAYTIVNWNILGAYTSVEKLIDQFQGRGATARMLDSLAENFPNIHPKKDVIDSIASSVEISITSISLNKTSRASYPDARPSRLPLI